MKIKTKVFTAILILVMLLIAQGVICNIYLNRYSEASKLVLKDNYRSLEYGKEMINALDDIQSTALLDPQNDHSPSKAIFETNLKAEENNITEPGENEMVKSLSSNYEKYNLLLTNAKSRNSKGEQLHFKELTEVYKEIKNTIISIMNINMNAITNKSNKAEEISQKAIWYIALIEILALMIMIPILFLFPTYISRPICDIIEKIREIANHNYNQKIEIKRKDEIGELAEEFNMMTDKLRERHG